MTKRLAVFLCVLVAFAVVAGVFVLTPQSPLCPEEECRTNADCPQQAYCYRAYSSKCDEETCSQGDAASYGVCKRLDLDSKILQAGDNTYTASISAMSHWSAKRFCAAHGLKPLALVDLACQTPLVNEITLERQACAPVQTAADGEKGKFTFEPELSEIITSFWLNDVQANACYAYRVHSDTRMVFRARRSAEYQALCVQ